MMIASCAVALTEKMSASAAVALPTPMEVTTPAAAIAAAVIENKRFTFGLLIVGSL
ncbi:hypothetical protein WDY80_05005 [Gordonia hongkongensis]|uniref:hypothetical protein n=1 Tax=Gordonia TaxID=2053 RepID=UPI001CFB4C7D|nr:hypothetical protein [Gordonia sp. WA4-43]UCZ89435.1 hypothetical protein LEL84_20760 [Gordonia sp. WA4-43]